MTRAQEAEENYVIKRELAVVRQQCNTASESLEKAQDTIRELQQQKVITNAQSMDRLCAQNRTQQTTAGEMSFSPHICQTSDLCYKTERKQLSHLLGDGS